MRSMEGSGEVALAVALAENGGGGLCDGDDAETEGLPQVNGTVEKYDVPPFEILSWKSYFNTRIKEDKGIVIEFR